MDWVCVGCHCSSALIHLLVGEACPETRAGLLVGRAGDSWSDVLVPWLQGPEGPASSALHCCLELGPGPSGGRAVYRSACEVRGS